MIKKNPYTHTMYMYKEGERGFQIDSLYIKLYKI